MSNTSLSTALGNGSTSEREIMIVDDDRITVMIVRRILDISGVQANVTTFENGKLALDYLSRIRRRCLVLLDINMPVMNGWQFLDAITEHGNVDSVDVVIFTSSVDAADHERAGKYSIVQHYIEKPFTSSTIAEMKRHHRLTEFFDHTQARMY